MVAAAAEKMVMEAAGAVADVVERATVGVAAARAEAPMA